jgi:hypothetical protein
MAPQPGGGFAAGKTSSAYTADRLDKPDLSPATGCGKGNPRGFGDHLPDTAWIDNVTRAHREAICHDHPRQMT